MLLRKCLPVLLYLSPVFAQAPLAKDPKAVVAVVDGKNVTWADIEEMMLIAPPQVSAGFEANPRVALLNWFLMKHLGQEGLERKLDQQSPTKEQIEMMKLQFLADARINEETNGYKPTPAEVQKYYQAHLNDFQRVSAKGILIKFKVQPKAGATSTEDLKNLAMGLLQAGSVQRSEEEAQKIAKDVAAQLRNGGDIEALAEKYSEDESSKSKGGDVGFVSFNSKHADEVRNAALRAVPGSVPDPVGVPAGFWILQVGTRSPLPLESVSFEIEQAVRAEHMKTWMDGLRDRFQVEIKDPTIGMQPKPGAQAPKPAPVK
jgi:parvulin-like peptidyl-prolyl isomerase